MRNIENILLYLKEQRGIDFSGYRSSMLERRIQKRIFSTKCNSTIDYFEYLRSHTDELENLIDVFTINVSHFFRNPMPFEFLQKIIVPEIIASKKTSDSNHIRIWSAGCSFGEEPYSIAMILSDQCNKDNIETKTQIFATDLDKKAIERAREGFYSFNSIENVKAGMLKKYFTKEYDGFRLVPEVKQMVQFSFHDLLDKNNPVPSDSIFGAFDLVLCRNVLIYFEPEHQKIIFDKLYHSLNTGGYLVLGEAETPIEGFKHKFSRENKYCKIYRKNS